MRRPRREDVRSDLLTHATHAFEHVGYAVASLATIAADAGYTKGAVYSSFPGGKPQLFAEVCRQHLESRSREAMARVEHALAAGGEHEALVDALAGALTSAALDAPASWQLLLNEFRMVALRDESVAAAYREFVAWRVQFLVDLFHANRYLAPLGRPVLTRAATVLTATANAIAVEHLLTPETVDRESVEQSVRAVLAALTAPLRAPQN